MTDRELMQQALDALNHKNVQDRMQVINALRERLAQPDMQPCAAPVRTKDLTDGELQPFLDEWWNLPCDTAHDVKNIFRAVISADREKNK